MPGIDDILAIAEDPAYRRVVTARVALVRQELRDEHAHLEALLPTLVSDTIDAHPLRHQTAERLAAIEAEIEAATVEFRFVALGHRAWADLLRKHPPTRQQLSQRRDMDHNPETFPYEAIAASCTEPVMTADDVRRLEASPAFDVAAWNALWDACLRANVADTAPNSLAAGLILRQNGGSATTAAHGAFPAPSSSAAS
jgi:hypothetical protein